MKPEILIVGPMYSPTQARLETEFTAHRLWEAADREAFLRGIADRVRGIAVYALHGCPATVIEALPRLEVIACMGIGVDAIDVACAKSRGVIVTNTPDVVTEDTADIALGLMLAVERRIAAADRFVRRGDWLTGDLPFGRALRRRKLGIIGLGRIGQAIAHRAAAFGMEIAYQGPRRKAEFPTAISPNRPRSPGRADIVAVACPGGKATRNLVDRAVMRLSAPRGASQYRARFGGRRAGARCRAASRRPGRRRA